MIPFYTDANLNLNKNSSIYWNEYLTKLEIVIQFDYKFTKFMKQFQIFVHYFLYDPKAEQFLDFVVKPLKIDLNKKNSYFQEF